MDFALHFLIVVPCILEHVVTYCNIYTKLEVIAWKEHEAVFLKRKKFIFSIVVRKIWFVSCFRLKTFTSNVSTLLLPWGVEGRVPWILICSSRPWNYNANRNNKKIPCYMRDSACRWLIVKKVKICRSYVKYFWIFPRERNCRILI